MNVFKRILGVLLMLVSLLVGLLCIGGIVGAWSLSNALTRGLVTVLSGADEILGMTEDALNRLDNRVGAARGEVASFEEDVLSAAETFVEEPVVLTALSERMDLGIGPAVSDLRDSVQSIRETVLAIQQTVQAINALPFVSLGEDLPGGEKLGELSAGITALNEGVQEIRGSIREAKAEAAAFVLRVGKATARVDAGLARIETAASGMSGQVSAARSDVSVFQTRATRWLDIGAATLTAVFLWFFFVHVVAFILGLSMLRGKNLFERWVGAPTPVPIAVPIEAVAPAEAVAAVESAEIVEAAESPELAEPVEPDEAVESVEPVAPVEPDQVAEESKPVEPAEPEEPVESVKADKAAESPELAEPQGGDNGER